MTIPRGLYETLLTEALADSLREAGSNFESVVAPLDPGDSYLLFVRLVRDVLRRVLMSFPAEERIARQAAVSNQVIELLNAELAARGTEESGNRIASPVEQLLAFLERKAGLGVATAAASRPAIPLTTSDLLMNARGEPNLGHVLAREFPSADRIDLICAFIRWNGLRVLGDSLRAFCQGGRPLRVLTTTYTGSTERRALDLLVELGAKVKVSYDTQMTRLHAKAWLFHRDTGFSTAYIGSSNLSRAAMVDGREWNVRLSQADAGPILEKFGSSPKSVQWVIRVS